MAERGRPPGFVMSPEHRTKIANSQILNRLIKCAEGDLEMSATQATVALGLMKKVMPDLTSTTVSGDQDNPVTVLQKIELVPVNSTDKASS